MNEQYEQIEPLSPVAFLAIFFGSIFGVIVLLGIWPFIVCNKEFRRCVPLKNGINLGYNAVLDFSSLSLRPYVIPKFADGTPLVDQPIWSVIVTATSIYGSTWGKTGEPPYAFAWREDIGAVWLKDDERDEEKLAAHRLIVKEAGPELPGLDYGHYGAAVAMNELLKQPGYEEQWCSTNLVDS